MRSGELRMAGKLYGNIMKGLEEAIQDAKGNGTLPRKTIVHT